jgi:hypothetical protein
VDVTEDHSLLDPDGEEVRPSSLAVGDHLLHNNLPILDQHDTHIGEAEAWAMGLFYADGSCGRYYYPRGHKSSWAINNQNLDYLKKAQEALTSVYENIRWKNGSKTTFKILDTMKSSSVYKLVPCGEIVSIVEYYRRIFYDKYKNKIIPPSILSSPNDVKLQFLLGYYAGDGLKSGIGEVFDMKGKIGAAGMYHLTQSLGYNISLNTRKDKRDIFRLTLTKKKQRKAPSVIKKIEIISDGNEGQFVYDLETSNHHFSAGIGRLVVHNTDSTMVQIPNVTDGLDCLKWGKKLEIELSDLFPDPLYLEFEKAGPQLTIKKKNYLFWVMNRDGTLPYDDDGNPVYLSKGIPLARRDKSKWQRRIVRDSLNMILKQEPHQKFLDMVIESVVRTLRGEIKWTDFSTIKSLGSGYKSQSYFMKIFSDELRLMGRPAQPGDRLEFVIVDPKIKLPGKSLLGYRMRLLDIYSERLGTEEEEKIDYLYYVNNLLMKCIDNYWKVGYKTIIDQVERQNIIDDNLKILNELIQMGLGAWVEEGLNVNDRDPCRTVQALLLTAIKNKVITARRKHVSGRDIFDCRMNGNPIKTLLKAENKNLLEVAVKTLASPELYHKLYPIIFKIID